MTLTRPNRLPAAMSGTLEIWLATVSIVGGIALSNAFLHRELASLCERLAKLEGAIEGFFAGKAAP